MSKLVVEGQTLTDYAKNKWGVSATAPCSKYIHDKKDILPDATHHLKTCVPCKILAGTSNATVLNQSEIARLFKRGIDGKRSGSNNYKSKDGILYHYRTIEGVRTVDGVVIRNTQCWSGGFAYCSLMADYYLPLSLLSNISESLRDIKILSSPPLATLFTMPVTNRGVITYLFGYDERIPYLVELKDSPKTLKDAYESLKPNEAKQFPYIRQGDLFFIERTAPILHDIENQHFVDESVSMCIDDEQHYGEYRRWGDYMPTERRLVRPRIILGKEETRHEAQTLAYENLTNAVFVKGWISHPQHHRIKLNGFRLVRKNQAVQSWDASRRGGGGD